MYRILIRILRIRMFLGIPDPHPDPSVRGTDPRICIRIRTNMSRIPNTVKKKWLVCRGGGGEGGRLIQKFRETSITILHNISLPPRCRRAGEGLRSIWGRRTRTDTCANRSPSRQDIWIILIEWSNFSALSFQSYQTCSRTRSYFALARQTRIKKVFSQMLFTAVF